jgi:hypothetical protein
MSSAVCLIFVSFLQTPHPGLGRSRRCQARQGSDFDLKAFHRAALDLGLLGLDPLRAALALI